MGIAFGFDFEWQPVRRTQLVQSIKGILHQHITGHGKLKFTDHDEGVRNPELEQRKSCVQSAAGNDTQGLVSIERLPILQDGPAVLRLCGGTNEVD